MKKRLILPALLLFLSLSLSAICPSGDRDTLINDGPYYFLSDDTLRVIWIESGTLHKGYLLPGIKNDKRC